jgi:Rieske Fe-S protein
MEDISRRGLFAGACAALLMGSALVPQAANASIKKLPRDRLSVKLSGVPQLAKVGGSVRIGLIKKIPVAIARTGPSTYVAFNLSCPHQGVIVDQTPEGWVCSAHLSKFEPDGDLVLGPATTGLRRVPIKVSKGVATVG